MFTLEANYFCCPFWTLKKYKFELIRKGNMGVCGARQWAAQHFHDSKAKYIVWFEDDMLMENKNILCKNGLSMHCDNWLDKCIKIIATSKRLFNVFIH